MYIYVKLVDQEHTIVLISADLIAIKTNKSLMSGRQKHWNPSNILLVLRLY